MGKQRDDRPLVWAGLQGKDNVLVLSHRAVYVTRLRVKDVPQLHRAFDEGQEPEEALQQYRRISLERIVAIEYQHSAIYRVAMLSILHTRKGATRRTEVAFTLPAEREAFKVELQARLPPCETTETIQHPALTILKYLPYFVGIVLATGFLSYWEWKGADSWFLGSLIIFFGAVGCLLTVGMAVRELRRPPLKVTYEPHKEPEPEMDEDAEPEAENP
jgi:hypothetical protein